MKVKFNIDIGVPEGIREEIVEMPNEWSDGQIYQDLVAWSEGYIKIKYEVLETTDERNSELYLR